MGEELILTELVLVESELILEKRGNNFQVVKGEGDRRKFKEGNCYFNSVEMMKKDYGYVEGYVTRKSDNYKFGHAWNVDSNGQHIDFTMTDPENYNYFGIVIPKNVVWEVGEKNGQTWFSVLPFVDEDFNFKGD